MSYSKVRRGWFWPFVALLSVLGSLLAPGGASSPFATAVSATAGYDWLQFDGDAQHSGNNTQEALLSASNVATLSLAFQVTLPAVADGAPAYLSGVSTRNGTQDLLFVTTKAGDIVALDAHSGSQLWIQHNPAGSCRINNGSAVCYTTSSPAIDPTRQDVYSYGLDGKVHKYAVGTGSEVTTGGWPQITTLKAFDEKGSPALSIATAQNGTTYLYVANGGYPGDRGDYQGHLTAINLSTGSQVVFNTLCSNQAVHFVETPGTPDCPQVQAAVWARPGVVYASATNRIYLGTGNGLYAPATFAWGDSVLALTPDGTSAGGSPLDSYTPTNYQSLQNSDLDLGSTAPAILAVPPSSSVAHLAVQGGKDGILRLLNLDNLSGQGGAGHTGGEVSTLSVPQGGEILTQPATWVNPTDGSSWVFVANANGIAGLKLVIGAGGAPSLQAIWQQSGGGSSPVVANNVVYYATNGSVRALAPTTGGSPLWQGAIGGIHWESPIVANGMLYSTDENSHLTGFALPGQPTQTATPSPTVTRSPTATSTTTSTLTPTSTLTQTSTPTATATSSVTNSPTATSTATPTRSPLPDLVVRGLTNPPATAHPGSSFTVFDAVFNVGSTTAGSSTTRFYLSADTKRGAGDLRLAGQQSVPSLNPGANAHGLTNVTIPTAVSSGTYYLLGCADDLRQVQEANERNNCSASTTTVQVAP